MASATPDHPTASHLAQVFAQYPIDIAHGEGVWLSTRDGRKILDFYGGHAVAGLGYGHPRWLAAIVRPGPPNGLPDECGAACRCASVPHQGW